MQEIIVKFKNKNLQEEFIDQMMDGFGENYCNFSHWHKNYKGEYIKKYCPGGRLICTVNEIFKDTF